MEERCWREYCWCTPGDHTAETKIASELHSFYGGWQRLLSERGLLKDLPVGPTPIEITLVRRAEHHSICYPLNRLLGLHAERQFCPKLIPGSLESLYKPEDFDLCLIRHGIVDPRTDERVRRQPLPFQEARNS